MQKKGYWSFDEKKQARKIMRSWRRKSEREREQKAEKKKETDAFTFGIGRVSNHNV